METYNPFSLKDKTILITGASSGIGQQCAIDCSKMGASVILVGRNEKRLNYTYSQMIGDSHKIYVYDLTDFDNMKSWVKGITDENGPLDGVLHCAGISTTLPLKMMSLDKLDTYFKGNVYTAVELTRELCRYKNLSSSGASVIFFSSIMGLVGEVGKSLYAMTKGALVSLVRALACEYASRNIRFNSVSPGAIMTPINENLPHMSDPLLREKLESKHLLGLGNTVDVSNACIYLLSDASRWVTGTNLIVDGGYTAK